MKTSPDIAELSAALAKAQAEMSAATKSRSVTVQTKTSGSYTFEYATLDDIWDACRGPLTKYGLSVTQAVGYVSSEAGVNIVLTTRLLHASGQWLETEFVYPANEELQKLGSSITYLRRYCMAPLVGITPDEDDDANSASGNSVQKQQRPTPQTAGHDPFESFKRAMAECQDEELANQTLDAFLAGRAPDPIKNRAKALAAGKFKDKGWRRVELEQ